MPDTNEVGSGAMRFAPKGERSHKEQLDSLGENERECVEALKAKWQAKQDKQRPGQTNQKGRKGQRRKQ